jgi:hypothetical protein
VLPHIAEPRMRQGLAEVDSGRPCLAGVGGPSGGVEDVADRVKAFGLKQLVVRMPARRAG